MDRVDSVQLFIRVVETSSFSKAAAELGIAQPTATKAIAATEARLGVRLLHRSTRGVTATEVGALYYDKCKVVERALDDAENLAAHGQGSVRGQLRISTSVAFGRRLLSPLVLRYMQENPAIKIDISFDDRYVDLVEQGMDLAIRLGQMADSALGARYLGNNPWLMVASRHYIAKQGEPVRVADLAQHDCLVYSSVQGDDHWRLSTPEARTISVPVNGPLRSNNLTTVLSAACLGMGVAILPWYVARESLANAQVQAVMTDHGLPDQEMHAVFPTPKFVPPKVTEFIDYLQRELAGQWWLREPAKS